MTDETQLTKVSEEQEKNFQDKVQEIVQVSEGLRREGILCHYKIGVCLVDVFKDEDGSKYGKKVMTRLSECLGIRPQTLYSCQEMAVNYTEEEVTKLADTPNVTYTHLREAVRIPDKDARNRALLELAENPDTVSGFREKVLEVRENCSTEGEDGSGEPQSNSGGGSRTGSGRGASPMTPVNRITKSANAIGKALKDAMIAIGGFEADSDTAMERMNDAVNESLGPVSDAIVVMAGYIQYAEELLLLYPDLTRGRVAEERSVLYSEVATLLSGMKGKIADRPKKIEDVSDAKPLTPKDEPPKEKKSTGKKAPVPPPAKPPEAKGPPVVQPPAPEDKSCDLSSEEAEKELLKQQMKDEARKAREKAGRERGVGVFDNVGPDQGEE